MEGRTPWIRGNDATGRPGAPWIEAKGATGRPGAPWIEAKGAAGRPGAPWIEAKGPWIRGNDATGRPGAPWIEAKGAAARPGAPWIEAKGAAARPGAPWIEAKGAAARPGATGTRGKEAAGRTAARLSRERRSLLEGEGSNVREHETNPRGGVPAREHRGARHPRHGHRRQDGRQSLLPQPHPHTRKGHGSHRCAPASGSGVSIADERHRGSPQRGAPQADLAFDSAQGVGPKVTATSW